MSFVILPFEHIVIPIDIFQVLFQEPRLLKVFKLNKIPLSNFYFYEISQQHCVALKRTKQRIHLVCKYDCVYYFFWKEAFG